MPRLDFAKLREIQADPSSKDRVANESGICRTEFEKLIQNLNKHATALSEEELSLIIMTLQNWIDRRNRFDPPEQIKVGEIYLADLGNNYKPEFSFIHPVLILEIIGNMLLVIPTSSSAHNIHDAYHPVENPHGLKYLRKVQRNDGFARTSALLLSHIRTISPGRLLGKKGEMPSTSKGSVFAEVKQAAFQLCFPRQYLEIKTSLVDRSQDKE